MAHRKCLRRRARPANLLLAAAVAVLAVAVSAAQARDRAPSAARSESETPTVRLALDWTPNTNHTGFFVAQAKGYYKQAGINFKIIPYSNAATDTLVGHGKAECGINFEDFMTIAAVSGTPEKSVMAILQHPPLAIMVRADSRFHRPRDLDGATYGGFGLPGEKEIIQAIIRNDGGKGDFKAVTLDTGAYEAVYAKRVDFSEGFLTWEVIEAKLRGIKLRLFPLDKYGFPDFYSVVLACNTDWLRKNQDVAKRFVAATVKGWQFAQAHPSEASVLLIKENPGVFSNTKLVYQSDYALARDYWLDPQGRFGCQTLQEWTAYPKFLYQVKVYKDRAGKALTSPPKYGQFFTNAYLPYTC